jgi:hypothetical protein
MSRKRQLISSCEAKPGKAQHTEPCSDCPMARTALPGWLGGATAQQYACVAHSDLKVDCHAIKGQQCAGMAIYRANALKRCYPPNLNLPINHKTVFSNPAEFKKHHQQFHRTEEPAS